MKTTLTVNIDEELIPKAEQVARERGLSLSELVETSLRSTMESPESTFSERWRGKFKPSDREDERYKTLAGRYL